KGTDKNFKAKIFSNLSEKKQQIVKDEMLYLGPQKASLVDQARKELLNTLRKKQQLGRIIFEGDTDFEKWVE
ncbi:FliG C-terminal domain-containing protein, partial [candidate division KSB1 bacterium]